MARAALTLAEESTFETIAMLAPVVQSWRLLLPAMALAVPLDGRCTSVLWHDARYVLLLRDSVRSFPPSPLHPFDVWIGCLVLALQTCFGVIYNMQQRSMAMHAREIGTQKVVAA